MRALVQRVSEASVSVGGEVVGSIGAGLCVLVGVTHTDDRDLADRLAEKVANLRVFDDDDGVMNRSLHEIGGAVLVVSQFTLYGDTRRGRRPSWSEAAPQAVVMKAEVGRKIEPEWTAPAHASAACACACPQGGATRWHGRGPHWRAGRP